MVQRAVAGRRDHQPLYAARAQRAHHRTTRAGIAADDLDARPRAHVGRQTIGAHREALRPRTPLAQLVFFHRTQRPRVARAEGVDAVGVGLAQVMCAVHQAIHHRHDALRAGMAGHTHGIEQVLRAVGL